MAQGSLHLDLTKMTGLTVDTKAMTLRVEPGTNFAAMYDACDKHGVLAVGGMCPVAPLSPPWPPHDPLRSFSPPPWDLRRWVPWGSTSGVAMVRLSGSTAWVSTNFSPLTW